ncbi:fungal-specific transcription factor domain-containing protein [Dactylonectria estremocensis]|uniref:Fungal-specific transcription factor domain-containing protein n=1 Tax=Dactylonectria estremocensis TaxID=1079267 RepID=A0A9P9IH61_9HYPO|nr:fungal-specific transcription factor domain-containing protein [Dactylonectria estremocensis]
MERDQSLPQRGAPFPTKYRRNYSRSKNGCLGCRARRKKCDATKPNCAACIRINQACVWPNADHEPQRIVQSDTERNSGLQDSPSSNPLATEQEAWEIVSRSLNSIISLSAQTLPSPQPSLTFGHASHLSPVSRPFYQQYLDFTADMLSRGPSKDGNPFLTYILPLAASDSLIMDCVLAIGGAHLSVNNLTVRRLEVATRNHYARILAGLKTALTNQMVQDPDLVDQQGTGKAWQVLLTLLLLCVFEGIQGDTHGAVYHHIKASRQYIVSMAVASTPKAGEPEHVRGFLLELYASLALKLAITPRGLLQDQPIVLDPFLRSLAFLGGYKSRGFLLGFGQRIFEIIPDIAQLVEARRLEEARDGVNSTSLVPSYKRLLARLQVMDPYPDDIEGLRPPQERAAATGIYQNALIMYLHSAFHVDMLVDPELANELEMRINTTIALSLSLYFHSSPFRRALLWPAIQIASCCRRKDHMEGFRLALNKDTRAGGGVKAGARVIQLLWDDPDPRAFGPRGVAFIMKKHGLSFSMC